MKNIVYFELKKILNVKKVIALSIVLVLLCIGSFAIILAMGNWKGAAEMLSFYQGSVEGHPGIEAAKERYEELCEQYIEPGIEMDEATWEEFNDLEYPLWLDNCDEARKSNLQKDGFTADTLVIGDTIFYAFVEEFIANYLPFIMGFVIAFLLAPVFASEYANNMDSLLLSAKHGKKKLIFGKLIASGLVIFGAYGFVLGIFMVMSLCLHGIGDLNASFVFTADNVYIYLSSPFNFSVGEYLLILFGCSLLGCVGVGCMTLFLSSKCRNGLSASMISLACVYVPILAFKMLGRNEGIVPNILRLFHGAVMGVRTLFSDYFPVRIGGLTMTMPVISISLFCFSSVFFVVAAFQIFRKHQVQN